MTSHRHHVWQSDINVMLNQRTWCQYDVNMMSIWYVKPQLGTHLQNAIFCSLILIYESYLSENVSERNVPVRLTLQSRVFDIGESSGNLYIDVDCGLWGIKKNEKQSCSWE